ncbi:MAG: helix-turn-helix domain-containing protein [Candidatus Tectimicrobiota bacterium]
MGRKPLLAASQITYARELLEQGKRTVQVASLLNVSRRTLERALQHHNHDRT